MIRDQTVMTNDMPSSEPNSGVSAGKLLWSSPSELRWPHFFTSIWAVFSNADTKGQSRSPTVVHRINSAGSRAFSS